VDFLFLGNAVWIDFVNSGCSDETECLSSFDDLLAWGLEAGILDVGAKRSLQKSVSRSEQDRILREARGLRSALESAAKRMLGGEFPRPAAISRVNGVLRDHPRVIQLRKRSGEWSTRTEFVKARPHGLLAAIAEDFANFVVSCEPDLLRECQKEPCSLLFYDTSRNHARRWCSMQICGNRTKVARHRARQAGHAEAYA